MAAKQRLCKGRMRARHLKLKRIAALVGVSEDFSEDPFASSYLLNNGFCLNFSTAITNQLIIIKTDRKCFLPNQIKTNNKNH